MTKKQKVPAAVEEIDDPFDTMMSALDWHFHVSRCRGHTREERTDAFHAAHESFLAFIGDDPLMDAEANAPTTMTVH
jgi:hypothetical protein